jgi:NAD(P)-dependent dehydrogenase (short-subunit alcohol dehydrogenase family)
VSFGFAEIAMQGRWTHADMPPMSSKLALVTGANRGLGFEIASALAAAGANVVLACRDPSKAAAAAERIRHLHPDAALETAELDIADPASVRGFAETFQRQHDRLDLLIHNAAAILVPLQRTAAGHELHLATNHLGPFALTGLLLDRLRSTPDARVIHTGSLAHRLTAGLDLADPHFKRAAYAEMEAYGRSKLAALTFHTELTRRLARSGSNLRSLAAHPGYTATNPDAGRWLMRLMTAMIAQSPAMGALPALYAATMPDAHSGDYFGPGGLKELRGYPRRVACRAEAQDASLGAALWTLSEQLTGVRYLQD